MTDAELAYCAGFFDGEGCCGIKARKGGKTLLHSAYVTVSQVRPEVLHWMRAHFGGAIHLKAAPKSGIGNAIWTWQTSNKLALNFLRTVLPHLRVKKGEAELVIAAFDVRTRVKKLGVPAEIVDLRERNRQRLMEMR